MSLYLGGAAAGELALCVAAADGWQVRLLGVDVPAPLALARRADGRVLYVAHAGGVSAFAIGGDGGLALLGRVACGLVEPVAMAVSADGAWLLVAERDGIVVMVPLASDGRIGTPASRMTIPDAGVAALAVEPAGGFVLAADAAGHAVHVLRWAGTGHLVVHRRVPRPGDAPHGVVFHPDIPVVFLADADGVSACHWDAEAGHLTGAQALRPLPREYSGANRVAGMVLSPDGRFLFVANAGHDSLATVAVQRRKGKMFLRRLDRLAAGVAMLGQSPDGGMLLAAGAGVDGIAVEGRYAMLSRRVVSAVGFAVRAVG